MKKCTISAMLVFLPIIATAEESGGIEHSNYNTSISGGNSVNGNFLALGGGARFPVVNYVGMSLNAGLFKFNGNNNFVDSTGKSIGLGGLVRKYDLGIVNVNYSHSESEFNIPFGTWKNNTNSYSLSGTYYIKKFDLSLSRTIYNSNTSNISNTSYLDVAYYVNDNLSVSASVRGMNADKSSSLISASYQPQAFNNAISVSASYGRAYAIDSYGIAISYYFDTKVSLIDRIRRY